MDATNLLTHLDSVPRETFPWGALQWLCNAERMPGALLTLGVCDLERGQGNPRHYHPNCEEVLLVLEGDGRHQIEDDWLELRAGSMIRIPTGTRHKLVNTGRTKLRCVIAFSSGTRETVFWRARKLRSRSFRPCRDNHRSDGLCQDSTLLPLPPNAQAGRSAFDSQRDGPPRSRSPGGRSFCRSWVRMTNSCCKASWSLPHGFVSSLTPSSCPVRFRRPTTVCSVTASHDRHRRGPSRRPVNVRVRSAAAITTVTHARSSSSCAAAARSFSSASSAFTSTIAAPRCRRRSSRKRRRWAAC